MKKDHKVFYIREHEEKINRIVHRNFSTSLMSNAKWKKVFNALDNKGLILDWVFVKRVDAELPYRYTMVKSFDAGEEWVTEGRHKHFKYFYNEIEWLELISRITPDDKEKNPYTQDVEKAFRILKSIGQFDMKQLETGLRIYGYRK